MSLHYQYFACAAAEQQEQSCPIIIIPGLFGSVANWRGFAKHLSQSYSVYVIDQRNHGQSPYFDSNTYQDMVEDLKQFLQEQGLSKVVLCGHSMGGKVAMLFTLLHSELVEKLLVLDIAPVSYSHSHAPFLDALMKLDLTVLKSRAQADEAVKEAIPDTATRLFLLQSLTGKAGRYQWRLNLTVLKQYMPDIVGFPADLVGGLQSTVKTTFFDGETSDYIKPENIAIIKSYFPAADIKIIIDAGHWLHVEQAEAVLNAVLGTLSE